MQFRRHFLAVAASAMIVTPAFGNFDIQPLATFQHGVIDEFDEIDASEAFDESAAEIVVYDDVSQKFFVVNAFADTVDVLTLDEESLSLEFDSKLDLKDGIEGVDGFVTGGPNSVAVFNGLVAVAIEDDDKQANGRVAFFDAVSGDLINSVAAGALPDMVTFTPDGSKAVVANEGEPSDDYLNDPEGSITIVDLSFGAAAATTTQVSFAGFNGKENLLRAKGVRIFGPGASAAQDLEPEYIAVSADSSTAFVSLQENNAIAAIDLRRAKVKAISPLGTKKFYRRGNELDYTNKDKAVNIVRAPFVGMYQPDAIATFQRWGQTFVVTANEGDARDYDGFSEEVRVEDLNLDVNLIMNYPGFLNDDDLGRPKTTTVDGDTDGDGDVDVVHLYGARSITVWKVRPNGKLRKVADTGSILERAVAEQFPALFNATNDEDGLDDRSDDKGPEPEAISIAKIGGKPVAFVGLERSSQVALFDLQNPFRPRLIQLVNNRVNGALGLDLGPESVIYIDKSDSPIDKALMAVANEVSGTTTVYTVKPQSRKHKTGDRDD